MAGSRGHADLGAVPPTAARRSGECTDRPVAGQHDGGAWTTASGPWLAPARCLDVSRRGAPPATGRPCVVDDQGGVRAAPTGRRSARRSGPAATASRAGPTIPAASASAIARCDRVPGDVVGECHVRRHRHAHEGAAPRARDRDGRRRARPPRRRRRRPPGPRMPGRAREEPGHLRLADRDDRHAPRLEVLQRGRHVEDRLRARRRRRPSPSARAPRGRTRCRTRPCAPPATRPGPRDGRRRCRRSRRPGCPPRTPRSSWPTRSSPPSRPRPARSPGSVGRPCGPSRPGPSRAPRARRVQPDEEPAVADRHGRRHGARRSRGRPPPTPWRPRGSAGTGSPWLISVDSRATTGRPSASAAGDLGGDRRADR